MLPEWLVCQKTGRTKKTKERKFGGLMKNVLFVEKVSMECLRILCNVTHAIATPTVGNPVVAQALELIHLAVVNARLMNHMQNKHKKLRITIINLSVKYVISYLHANKISVDT